MVQSAESPTKLLRFETPIVKTFSPVSNTEFCRVPDIVSECPAKSFTLRTLNESKVIGLKLLLKELR